MAFLRLIAPYLIGLVFLFGAPILNVSGVLFRPPTVQASSLDRDLVAQTIGAFSDLISMLTNLAVGLFVLIGFSSSYLLKSARGLSKEALGLAVLTLFFLMLSINMGYYSRAEMTSLLNLQVATFAHVESIVSQQALFLHISFSAWVTYVLAIIIRYEAGTIREVA